MYCTDLLVEQAEAGTEREKKRKADAISKSKSPPPAQGPGCDISAGDEDGEAPQGAEGRGTGEDAKAAKKAAKDAGLSPKKKKARLQKELENLM